MSTQSTIAREMPNGTFEAIYCNWDGYPSHHAVILKKYYETARKRNSLFHYGDMSSLGKNIGRKHKFESHYNEGCTFYSRDRGEKNCETTMYSNLRHLMQVAQDQGSYLYIYFISERNPGWYWCKTSTPNEMNLCTADETFE